MLRHNLCAGVVLLPSLSRRSHMVEASGNVKQKYIQSNSNIFKQCSGGSPLALGWSRRSLKLGCRTYVPFQFIARSQRWQTQTLWCYLMLRPNTPIELVIINWNKFGNPDSIGRNIGPSFVVEFVVTTVSTFIVHSYYAHTVWKTTPLAWYRQPLAMSLLALAFSSFGTGIGELLRYFTFILRRCLPTEYDICGNPNQYVSLLAWRSRKCLDMARVTVLCQIATIGNHIMYHLFSAAVIKCSFNAMVVQTLSFAQMVLAALMDVLTTISLCYNLRQGQTGFHSTKSMLRKLTLYIINRGILVALAQLAQIVTFEIFYSYPTSPPYVRLVFQFIGSKLYVNTMLALLNARRHLRCAGGSTLDLDDIFSSNNSAEDVVHCP
ncbi:hypothetical protein WOLCODRAFT_137102 [Wolfiporia cocos MD-104 SS10]|uniref:DUF6534 domain-containing protein n=1 Tax=Wolfiporia cocos (strain MD-104) TaxID=742152 RepID=A0A2H3JHC0_WOLCO|nr:hypothetical protein WOLCODRAFT_137102 [Wolfiporia cocos MD-104 SS10]